MYSEIFNIQIFLEGGSYVEVGILAAAAPGSFWGENHDYKKAFYDFSTY